MRVFRSFVKESVKGKAEWRKLRTRRSYKFFHSEEEQSDSVKEEIEENSVNNSKLRLVESTYRKQQEDSSSSIELTNKPPGRESNFIETERTARSNCGIQMVPNSTRMKGGDLKNQLIMTINDK